MGLETLIIDDDPTFAKLVELKLSSFRKDIHCTFASTLDSARSMLNERRFGLVVLDQHLPDGMGYEILSHPSLANTAVLAMSSDDAPEIPAEALRAGAAMFLSKSQLREKLFLPLVQAILQRKVAEQAAMEAQLKEQKLDVIRKLVGTLRHEINNPLGAVLGGAYLVKSSGELHADQRAALDVIEKSGKRIHHVLLELCRAADLEEVTKANEDLFQVPGDPKWDDSQ